VAVLVAVLAAALETCLVMVVPLEVGAIVDKLGHLAAALPLEPKTAAMDWSAAVEEHFTHLEAKFRQLLVWLETLALIF
jgi:hypothetical protein